MICALSGYICPKRYLPRVDPAGNIKPDKEKSREKIDGIVALIMAIDLALRYPESKSVYEKRGIRLLG